MSWGSRRAGTSINIKLSREAYEKISSRAAETRRSFHEVLREAIELSLHLWEKGDDIVAERDALRARNERLRSLLRSLREKKEAPSPAPPPPRPSPPRAPLSPEEPPSESAPAPASPFSIKELPLPPRRIPRDVQEKALREAQRRLESLRQQQRRWAKNLQVASQEEQKNALDRLKGVETSIPIVTVALAKGHKNLYDKRQERSELINHGRARGVAWEESERTISRGPVRLDPQELAQLEEEEWFGDPW